MAEMQEIPLELQIREANRRIAAHLSKGRKFPEFLLPMFLKRFLAIMDNHLSMNWDTISGIYDRTPFFPIMLIDTDILDDWCAHPSVWEVPSKQQHSWHVLTMIRYTLPTSHKGHAAIIFGVSFILIPTHQAQTSLSDALRYLKRIQEDSIILVSTPANPTFSPQPRKGKYLTMLPISGNPDIDRGPLHSFAAAALPVASRERRGGGMAVRIKLPPCFGSSK